jgi:hypothetical protein
VNEELETIVLIAFVNTAIPSADRIDIRLYGFPCHRSASRSEIFQEYEENG